MLAHNINKKGAKLARKNRVQTIRTSQGSDVDLDNQRQIQQNRTNKSA